MSNFYNEINKLTEDIVKHRVNEIQVEERINRLKKRYGEDAFPSFNFEKNPQLWSKSYLLELKEKNVTGHADFYRTGPGDHCRSADAEPC